MGGEPFKQLIPVQASDTDFWLSAEAAMVGVNDLFTDMPEGS